MEAEAGVKIDKSGWGPGPWQDEPDRLEFEHEGFPCLITRVPRMGHLCGYVAVPPGHPWHGQDYNDIDASVHGGLTYAKFCSGNICHVPKPGEPDNVYWLGFDHAHCNDLQPGSPHYQLPMYPGAVYRDIEYVKVGCQSLAEQAKQAAAAVKAVDIG